MNTRKLRKAILTLCSALLLVSLSVGMTIAYLTDTEAVKNTFTVGDVEITLDEANVDEYGEKIDETRVQENEYKLIPGHEYIKDPTVHVTKGSENSYIRMIVKITDIADLKAACGVAAEADFLPENFVDGWDPAVWVSTKEIKVEGDTCTYEFRYYTAVDASKATANVDLPALFTKIIVPGTATDEQIAKLEEMEILINAQAIQADTFKDADAAWDAWNEGTNFTPATPAPDAGDNTEGEGADTPEGGEDA